MTSEATHDVGVPVAGTGAKLPVPKVTPPSENVTTPVGHTPLIGATVSVNVTGLP